MKRFFSRLAAAILALSLLAPSASALSAEQARELLDEFYLRDLPAQAYETEDLDKLFDLLGDPYTYYMDAEEYQAFLTAVDGSTDVVGIGVSVQFTEQGILIAEVLQGGGALAAGLRAGDLIVAIDGAACVPAEEAHTALLTGAAGSTVTITVLRDGVARDYTIVRQLIHIPNTEISVIDGHIGYVDCNSFGSDTGALFASGLARYHSQTDCWLLDLRGNTGGYTDAAVDALGALAGPGYYLFLRDRQGNVAYYDYSASAVTDHPVIALVDGASASAAEAMAAGIRDTGTGIIVGTRTYGKGVAQIVCDSSTHSAYFDQDALKITAYRFYSAQGNTTDQIGVIPTLLIPSLFVPSVAKALCGSAGFITDGRLMLRISDQYFFLDLDQISTTTLSVLFAALPPSAQLWVGRDTYYWDEITTEAAAELLEVDFSSRYFSDLGGSPYAQEINTLASYYLLLGDGTGKFLPQGQLTRAQVCAMLAQLLGLTYTGGQIFSDVPDGVWYADDVNAMASLGLVQGVGGGRFQPDTVLSQQEFITILGRMARFLNFGVDNFALQLAGAELNLGEVAELAPFASWARESAAVLAWSAEEVLGKPNCSMLHLELDELSPTAPILREEAAACLYRMLSATGILTV